MRFYKPAVVSLLALLLTQFAFPVAGAARRPIPTGATSHAEPIDSQSAAIAPSPVKLQQTAGLARPLRRGQSGQTRQDTPASASERNTPARRGIPLRDKQSWVDKGAAAAATIAPQDFFGNFGTGSGDIMEVEPNDATAQTVAMPANIEGVINPSGDFDFFAFQAFANEQINVEAFASRISGSALVADIALFDSLGNMIAEDSGDGVNDPLIQVTSRSDQVLVAGITDVEGLGGPNFEYVLSIDAGIDVQEVEPNDIVPNILPALPVTISGGITSVGGKDLFSFTGTAGQTLIGEVDANFFSSKLNSSLTLIDPATGIQYFSTPFDGTDPLFNIVLPFTGTFVIQINAGDGTSEGAYRLNLSLVPGQGAGVVTSVTVLSKKLIEVTGSNFAHKAIVDVNAIGGRTTFIDAGTLQAKAKAKPGKVVTVVDPSDGRRSNPVVIE